MNQHYCHIAGIAAAIALGAETVVRPDPMDASRCQQATWRFVLHVDCCREFDIDSAVDSCIYPAAGTIKSIRHLLHS